MGIFYPAHPETDEMKQLLGMLLTMAIGMLPAAGFGTEDQSTTKGAGMVNITLETSKGDIRIELDADKAPVTVANFLDYARAGHYDNTVFHRVIGGFMIQGGGFDTSMNQKSTNAPIKNEADNGLKNTTGTIAMARTPDPHSATAQFFINVSDNTFLDFTSPTPQGWGYAVFGKVTDGMDVVRAIEKVQTGNKAGHQDVPLTEVVIKKVIIEE
jgi:peptidyl-prolyl cis-trans isomerase B (cyclophilin B)